jgi:DNA-binding IscR family transcriptional regulator
VIEGPVAMNMCTVNRQACGLRGHCKVHPFWVAVRGQVERLLTEIDFEKIAGPKAQEA